MTNSKFYGLVIMLVGLIVIAGCGLDVPDSIAEPYFTPNPANGPFSGSVSVQLGSPTDGAEIFYTLDGSEPGPNSPTYSTPLLITENTVINAISMKEGMVLSSSVVSATYVIE